MARFYVGRLRDGEEMVQVLLWDARSSPPPPLPDGLHAAPRSDAPARRDLDLATHLRQIGHVVDDDVDHYLCDLIERSWDERTMRH